MPVLSEMAHNGGNAKADFESSAGTVSTMTIMDCCHSTGLRQKVVAIPPELILQLFHVSPKGVRVDDRILTAYGTDVVPKGARALRAGIDEQGRVCLVIESTEFDEVQGGHKLPKFTPQFQSEPITTETTCNEK